MLREVRRDRLPRNLRQREIDSTIVSLQGSVAVSLSGRIFASRVVELPIDQEVLRDRLDGKARYIAASNPWTTVAFTEAVARGVIRTLLHAAARRCGSTAMAKRLISVDSGAERNTETPFQAISPIGTWDRNLIPEGDYPGEFASTFETAEILSAVGYARSRGNWEFLTPTPDGVSRSVNLRFTNQLGSFATPYSIAQLMASGLAAPPSVTDTGSHNTARICDPACGAGVLLLAAGEELLSREARQAGSEGWTPDDSKKGRETIARVSLYGADTDRESVSLCQLTIGTWGGIEPESVDELPIVLGDSLQEGSGGRQLALDGASGPLDQSQYGASAPVRWHQIVRGRSTAGAFDGFDAVIMNPPYGRLKTHSTDYTNGENRSSLTLPAIKELHAKERESLAQTVRRFRRSPSFANSTLGELDWYRLFLERAIGLLRTGGSLSAIVPASFLSDRNSTLLRRVYLESFDVRKIVHFVETANLFPTVGQPTCIILATKGNRSHEIQLIPNCRDVLDVAHAGARIPVRGIEGLSDTLAIPALEKEGWTVLNQLRSVPRIRDDERIRNLRGELELTLHKRFVRESGRYAPLVRGDSIERFRSRSRAETRKASLVDVTHFLPFLGGSEKVYHHKLPRLAGRQCAYLEKRRRLSFALVPPGSVVANSCNYLMVPADEAFPLPALLGLMNSTLYDWRIRITGATNHVNNYEVGNLPAPFRGRGTTLRRIGRLAQELQVIYSRMPFGESKEPTVPEEDALDVEVFQLFGIDAEQARHVVMQEGDSVERACRIRELMRR